MVAIATNKATISPTGSTITGIVTYVAGGSITIGSIDGSFILLDGSTFTATGASNGEIVNAAGTITFTASNIATVNIEGRKPLAVGDKGFGMVVGTRVSDGTQASFLAEFIVEDAGQSTITGS